MTSVPPSLPPQPPTTAAIDDLELQLGVLWRRARAVNHALTRSVHPDLEPAAYGLLSILMTQGRMRLTELARFVGVGKPSVSRQISFLEELDLVQRSSDPSDGRAQLIELTPRGQDKMRAVRDTRHESFHNLLEHWSADDVATLSTLIAKLNDSKLSAPVEPSAVNSTPSA